eukprot:369724_1
MPNTLHSAMLSPQDPIATQYKKQAMDDWNTILLNRCKELKEHGQMVIVNFCVDEDGQYLGNTFKDGCKTVNMHQLFCELWSDLVDKEEFVHTNFVNAYRTLDEMAAFDKDNIALTLVELKSEVVRCPFHVHLLNGETYQDGFEYATAYLPTTRTWSNSTFLSGLSTKRSAEEKASVVDALFDAYFKQIVQNPNQHRMDYVHGYAVFRKHQK